MTSSQFGCLVVVVALIAAWPLTRLTQWALSRRAARLEARRLRARAAKSTGEHDRLDGAA